MCLGYRVAEAERGLSSDGAKKERFGGEDAEVTMGKNEGVQCKALTAAVRAAVFNAREILTTVAIFSYVTS
jgi:hypothetical protein